ncbi:radical SAM protein [Patescibacteria group bacterium]|nr:radical SAM protein [Patescibacteria group bacterium]
MPNLSEVLAKLTAKNKTMRQKFNLGLAYLHFKARSIYLYSYPIRLNIDPCNYCNLQCALCPVGQRDKGRKQTLMTFDTYKKVLDECGPYLWEINLYNWGEPLLNKDVFKMIKYARGMKIDVNLSTNLNIFNDEICNNLIKCKLNKLIVSLDGVSQKSVEAYQAGNNFEVVIENMKRLIQKKHELGSDLPFLEWRFIVHKHNEHGIDRAKELAQELGVDKLEFLQIRCNMGQELLMNNKAQFENVKPWLPKNENLSGYDYSKRQKKDIKDFCRLLWIESVIQPDGSVSPCCAVWQDKFDFGNIRDFSFKEIWNGEKYCAVRRLSRGEVVPDQGHICNICKVNQAQV